MGRKRLLLISLVGGVSFYIEREIGITFNDMLHNTPPSVHIAHFSSLYLRRYVQTGKGAKGSNTKCKREQRGCTATESLIRPGWHSWVRPE
jgi:hypothetical protein